MLKNSSGFSLVEVMVTVVIVGILAAVAIPTYERSAFKSRQAEAQSNLSSLYGNMRAYLAEYWAYSTQLDEIGHRPTGTLLYTYGFGTHAPPRRVGALSRVNCINTTLGLGAACVPAAEWVLDPQYAAPAPAIPATAAVGAGGTTFAAVAHGMTYRGLLDSWSVNESKGFKNTPPP